jgi:hypothetical protein
MSFILECENPNNFTTNFDVSSLVNAMQNAIYGYLNPNNAKEETPNFFNF